MKKPYLLFLLLGVIAIFLVAKPYTVEAREDVIDSASIENDGLLHWDSRFGPAYVINPSTGELISCSSTGGKVIDFSLNGKVVTVTVWSEELPENTTYVIDIDKISQPDFDFWEGVPDDVVGVELDMNSRQLKFDTMHGYSQWIEIDTGKFVWPDYNEDDEVTYYNKTGNVITITIKNGIAPGERTYVFDITPYLQEYYAISNYDIYLQWNLFSFETRDGDAFSFELSTGKLTSASNPDITVSDFVFSGNTVKMNVTYKKIGITVNEIIDVSERINAFLAEKNVLKYYYLFEGNLVAFYTELGPYYLFNYATGELLETDSYKPSDAKVVGYSINGNNLEITVRSFERPQDEKYTFDLSRAKTVRGIGDGIIDIVEGYSYNEAGNILDFDSEQGPRYKIDIEKAEITYCSCGKESAKIISFETTDDKVIITLFSEELEYNVTYAFDRPNNKVSCDIDKIDDSVYEEQFNSIIEKVVSGGISETMVDSATAEKIKEAKNNNKKITTSVETNVVIPEKVETATVNLVNKKIKEAGLSASQYLDINISVYAEGEKLGNIKELETPIEFTIQVDINLNETDKTFYVLRIHNDQVDVLETKIVGDNTLSFETDRFSTYVLTYKEVQEDDNPGTIEETESGTDVSNITDNKGNNNKFKLWWILVPAGVVLVTIGALTIIKKIKK